MDAPLKAGHFLAGDVKYCVLFTFCCEALYHRPSVKRTANLTFHIMITISFFQCLYTDLHVEV